ncbi:hypothetical protein BGP_1389 [Beggiatoa sp. PS]|nr:hypothetical protein BGP_1389 [Beggiatoa sp. PS]
MWELGYQLNYLSITKWPGDNTFQEEEKILALIKSAGKLAKEMSWDEYQQQCSDKEYDDVPF